MQATLENGDQQDFFTGKMSAAGEYIYSHEDLKSIQREIGFYESQVVDLDFVFFDDILHPPNMIVDPLPASAYVRLNPWLAETGNIELVVMEEMIPQLIECPSDFQHPYYESCIIEPQLSHPVSAALSGAIYPPGSIVSSGVAVPALNAFPPVNISYSELKPVIYLDALLSELGELLSEKALEEQVIHHLNYAPSLPYFILPLLPEMQNYLIVPSESNEHEILVSLELLLNPQDGLPQSYSELKNIITALQEQIKHENPGLRIIEGKYKHIDSPLKRQTINEFSLTEKHSGETKSWFDYRDSSSFVCMIKFKESERFI